MSEFTQQEETEIVKTARDLTAAIRLEEEELEKLRAEQFEAPPLPPKRTVYERKLITPEAPKQITEREIKSKYGFFTKFLPEFLKRPDKKWIIFLLGASVVAAIVLCLITLISFVAKSGAGGLILGLYFSFMILLFFIGAPIIVLRATLARDYGKAIKQKTAEANNTPEMIKERERVAAENERRQKEADDALRVKQQEEDDRFKVKSTEFETQIMPRYESEKSRWLSIQQTKLLMLTEDIESNIAALAELYDTTAIIAYDYRDLWKLEWMYNNMSTSRDFTILVAMDRLDQAHLRGIIESQGDLTRAAIKNMEVRTMQGLRNIYAGIEDVYGAVERGNELSEEQISQIRKTRRDNNIANSLAFLQRRKYK